MNKEKVLFVCIHNSARSQMAEELLRKMDSDRFETESAGIEPGRLNPVVVDVLKEEGIDISGKKTRAVFDLFKEGRKYHYVITVCDETSAERCPVFPGIHQRIHWSLPDPSAIQGSGEDKLAKTREIKDRIKDRIREWLADIRKGAEK